MTNRSLGHMVNIQDTEKTNALKHMKIRLTSLLMRHIQIKLLWDAMYIMLAKIKKLFNKTLRWECEETVIPILMGA